MNRVDELNERLAHRNDCNPPPMYFPPRPVPTKHTIMPILDERMPSHVPMVCNSVDSFYPGNGPWAGLSIDVDSELRMSKHDYFPSSSSDMYHPPTLRSAPVTMPHPHLFSSVVATKKMIPPDPVVFNYCTR